MTRFKKMLAVVLTLALVLTILPVIAEKPEVRADETFVITSPTANKLVAAGYIDIEWTEATSGTVDNYQLYIDNQLVTTTTKTSYEYYTTKVKAFDVYVKANFVDESSAKTEKITFGVSKKGLGLAQDMGANLDLADMGVAWYYNWGEGPSSGNQYRGIEYVPMVWKETNANNFKNRVNTAKNRGYKYILTFNEPDLQGQCDMSVNDVYNVWKGISGMTGIKISSPVTALWPKASGNWFQPFMNRLNGTDYDPDFISIHCYPDNYGGSGMAEWFLEEVVDWAWETYHKPIWVTEFSTTGENITATGGNGTKEFWETVMPGLDEREYVERYAAFGFDSDRTGLWRYYTGNLTPGGEVYKNNGNPADFTAAAPTEEESDYTITSTERRRLLNDSVTINDVVCEDYVNASGVTASATTEINGGSGADKAIDGDINSRWESQHGIDPQSITIDLGTVRNIKEVSIVWENASASDYTIELSEDGKNYETVASVFGMNARQNRNDTIILKKMASGRYVKINGTSRTTPYGYSIYDLAIYGTEDTTIDGPEEEESVTVPEETTTKPEEVEASTGIKLSILNGATFESYVSGAAGNDATVGASTNGDVTVKINKSGNSSDESAWSIRGTYKDIAVTEGNRYSYTATLQSTKDKSVKVKITSSETGEVLVEDVIELKGGEIYTYVTEFIANSAAVDISYGFGTQQGEAGVSDTVITVKGNKLTSPDEIVTIENPTAEDETTTGAGEKTTSVEESSTKVSGESTTTLGKTKIKKATKKKSSKKAKIKLKKIAGATKYQVRISKKRSFKKKNILVKKTVKKVKFTIKSKKLKNKKKLFVRARAVKVVNGKNVYGKWSAKKKITIKK